MNTDRLLILITLGMCIIALAGCGDPETCEELAPQIVEKSEKHERHILKLYDIKEIEGTRKLECTANAEWSSGRNSAINFFFDVSDDGLHQTKMIGYRAR